MNRSDLADCLVFSEASYLSRYEAEDLAGKNGAVLMAAIHVGTVHCSVFRKGTTMFIATRGTDVRFIINIILDVRMLPGRAESLGHIHRGFLAWAWQLWPDIQDIISSEGVKADRVVFCGHSAGGAASNILAALSAPILKKSGCPKPWAVTFGAPRTGTWGFARLVGKTVNHVRITNNNDPVPHVPMWPLYMHASGTRYHITAEGDTVKSPVISQLIFDVPKGIWHFAWDLLKESVRTRSVLLGVVHTLGTGDHFIKNYRRLFR